MTADTRTVGSARTGVASRNDSRTPQEDGPPSASPPPRAARGPRAGVSTVGRLLPSVRVLDPPMTIRDDPSHHLDEEPRVVSATREIAAPADSIFALIADPSQQPRWDGNDNLARAEAGQRVHAVGDVFVMTLTRGSVRENHVVEFEEGRRIAWTPAEPGKRPPGHLWRWELEPIGASSTRVTHTYDWTRLTDSNRLPRARATTAERLAASIERLAALAENR